MQEFLETSPNPAMNPYRSLVPILVAAVALTSAASGHASQIAGWDANGLSNFGPSPWAPASVAANVTVGGLTRGAGMATTGTAAGNAWGGTAWQGQADFSTAVDAEAFVTFSITPAAGYKVSLTSIAPYNIRRSNTGPTTGQWEYRVGDSGFVELGDPITWGGTTSAAGNLQEEIDLSDIADLQDLPGGTTVEFRIVNYGASGAGTWYINNFQTGDDFIVNGVVEPENPDAPQLFVVPNSFPGFLTAEGIPSAPQSFVISGENLEADVIVTAPAGFEVSQTPGGGSGYATSQDVDESALPTTIYVRLAGTSPGLFSGDVTVVSTGAATQNVAVSGNVLAAVALTEDAPYQQSFPDFSTDDPDLPLGWAAVGSITTFPASAADGVWGSGTGPGLRGSAGVFGYQHTGITGVLEQILTLRNDTGNTIETLYVRYTGRVARANEGRTPSYEVTINGEEQPELAYSTASGVSEIITTEINGLDIPAGATFQIIWTSDGSDAGSPGAGARRQIGIGGVVVSTSEILTEPDITVAGTLTPFLATVGTPSASQSFTVSGTGLANGIIVTAPAGFQVSSDDEVFATTTAFYPATDTLPPTPVYVRLAASASPGAFGGLVSCTSTGATTREVAVSGTVGEPSEDYENWALGFGLDPDVTTGPEAGAPGADPDGDGFTNEQEFAFGTNPTVGNPALLTVTTLPNGDVLITYDERDSGASYVVQNTDNLSTEPWTGTDIVPVVSPDQTGVEPDYTRKQFTIEEPEGDEFFRIEATLAP